MSTSAAQIRVVPPPETPSGEGGVPSRLLSPLACGASITGLSVAFGVATAVLCGTLGIEPSLSAVPHMVAVMVVGRWMGERTGRLQARRWRVKTAAYTVAGDTLLAALYLGLIAAQGEELRRELGFGEFSAGIVAILAALAALGLPLTYAVLLLGEKAGLRFAAKRLARVLAAPSVAR